MARKSIEVFAALLLYTALICIITWPLAADLTGRLHGGDPYLNTWILSYGSTALFDNPLNMFDAPIFYPHATTLAYSENLIGMQPFFLPVKLISGSSVAGYNVVLLLAFGLAGLSMFLLCRFYMKWGFLPSGLAGLIFAFTQYRFDHVSHIHIVWTIWMPVAAWLLMLTLKENKWRYAAGLGIVFLLQATASLHMMAYLGMLLIVLAVFLLPNIRERLSAFIKLAVVGTVCIVVMIPLLLPYLSLKARLGYQRTEEQIVRYSASIEHLGATSSFGPELYRSLFGSISHYEKSLFIGFAVIILLIVYSVLLFRKNPKIPDSTLNSVLKWFAAVGGIWLTLAIAVSYLIPAAIPIVRAIHSYTFFTVIYPIVLAVLLWLKARVAPFHQAVLLSYLAIILIGIFLSLGPQIIVGTEDIGPGPFSLLMNMPLVGAFRVTARWFNLAIVGIAVIAAAGLQFLLKQQGKRRKVYLTAAFLLLLLAGYEHFPSRIISAGPLTLPSGDYTAWVKEQPDDFAFIEIPLRSSYVPDETEYLVRQLEHGKRIVNGYSGFLSPAYKYLEARAVKINSASDLSRLRNVSATACIVHLDILSPEEQEAWRSIAAVGRPGFSFIKQIGPSLIFKITSGANGRHGRFYIPKETTQIDFGLRGKNLSPHRSYFVDMYVDESFVKTLELSSKRRPYTLDLPEITQGGARIIEFYSSYQLKPGSGKSRLDLPFLVQLETGGGDPNHCIVGINGRYLPREKGINVYRVDKAGRVTETRVFNTSWYESENQELQNYISSISDMKGFLVIISRHLAARRLTSSGREALGRLGLANIAKMKESDFALGIVNLENNIVIFDRAGSEKISIGDAEFIDVATFELTKLNIR